MCKRIELLGLAFDPLRRDEAAGQIQAWIAAGRGKCRLVLLPSVEDVVQVQHDQALRTAHAHADLILAANWPIKWAARWLGKPLSANLAAWGLVSDVLHAASDEAPLSVFVLGASEIPIAEPLRRWPNVRLVGAYRPPSGFEHDHAEALRILARIADARPDLVLVTLTSPDRVLWLHRHRTQLPARVALCLANRDPLLPGEPSSVPVWMRDAGLDWLDESASQPRQLATRCARAAWCFPQIVFREWWQSARRWPLAKTVGR